MDAHLGKFFEERFLIDRASYYQLANYPLKLSDWLLKFSNATPFMGRIIFNLTVGFKQSCAINVGLDSKSNIC